MTTVRRGALKFNLTRLTDAELETIINNATRQVQSEQSFLHLLLAERTSRRLGIPAQRRATEDQLL